VALTPLQGLTVPAGTDSPNGPVQINALGLSLEPKLNMRFATAAARTAAFTAAGISPALGMLSYRDDAGYWEYYNATTAAWRVYGQYRVAATITSSASAFNFPSIPTYLRELRLTITARGDTAAASIDVGVQVNGASSNLYRYQHRYLQNGTVGTVQNINAPHFRFGTIAAASAAAGVFGTSTAEIVGWDSPHASYLTMKGHGGYLDVGTHVIGDTVGAASVTGPYTSLLVLPASGNFVAGSQFNLLGWE
jgi:hypothetical protein